GEVLIDGRAIGDLTEPQLRALRGAVVAYVPQDPGTALNPALRIGTQIVETLRTHLPQQSDAERDERVRSSLAEVALPSDAAFLRRFPHQLSGGQQQRVAIAIAFACRPRVIVCDEPTTGLDVTTQAKVLETVRELCRAHDVAAVYVSHDLAVVATLADRVAVMYSGQIVESGTREEIFHRPRHPYTRGLLNALPTLRERRPLHGIPGFAPRLSVQRTGCDFAPRCELANDSCQSSSPPAVQVGPTHHVRCLNHEHEPARALKLVAPAAADDTTKESRALLRVQDLNASYDGQPVLHDISLEVEPGECLALVGESGSGKTTTSRCIGGLHSEFTGVVQLDGETLARTPRARTREQRKAIQYVFQSPYSSLNPRRTVGATIGRQLQLFTRLRGSAAERRLAELLEQVSLSPEIAWCYPDQLSGGERQRVAIARALAAEPRLLVCDEITSALDVSVQAAIVETLRQLQSSTGVSMLFVTHNLALTRTVADRVAVMLAGRVVEHGPVSQVFDAPTSTYTRQLLEHTCEVDAPPGEAPAVRRHAAPHA
ncbi:MAG: ABC transporter ATP-binding protein, partial [Nocardioidaceae bacterium]